MRRCLAKISNGSTHVVQVPKVQSVLSHCVTGQYRTPVGCAERGSELLLQRPCCASTLRRVAICKDRVEHRKILTLNLGPLCWQAGASPRVAAGNFVPIPDQTFDISFLSCYRLSVRASVQVLHSKSVERHIERVQEQVFGGEAEHTVALECASYFCSITKPCGNMPLPSYRD